uniref:G-protein coupled receptors family 1 profile domain-containing protein n=1 Tax=Romanomermis culicivorax TaxID=13658 RepID=A0A915KU52_ROMCU
MNCSKELSYGQWRQCLKDFIVIKHFSQTEFVLFTTAYSLITLLGLLGNGLVIVVVISRPNMRTPRNVFITNLAAANFILSAIAIPFLWLPNYEVEFNHSLFFCKVASAFPGINIFCSTLTISIIAVDR